MDFHQVFSVTTFCTGNKLSLWWEDYSSEDIYYLWFVVKKYPDCCAGFTAMNVNLHWEDVDFSPTCIGRNEFVGCFYMEDDNSCSYS